MYLTSMQSAQLFALIVSVCYLVFGGKRGLFFRIIHVLFTPVILVSLFELFALGVGMAYAIWRPLVVVPIVVLVMFTGSIVWSLLRHEAGRKVCQSAYLDYRWWILAASYYVANVYVIARNWDKVIEL